MQHKDRSFFLKELYQRKFYNEHKAKTALQRVMDLQKKIQQNKHKQIHTIRNSEVLTSHYLIEEEKNQFRPTTNYSYSRMKREKIGSSFEAKKIVEGPASSELRFILDRKSNGQFNVLTQNIKDQNFHTLKHHYRVKHQTQRENRPQNSPQSKINKIDLMPFYPERLEDTERIKINEKKFYVKLKKKEQNKTVRDSQTESRKSKLLSKKVFIGGRDLQKAAQQYSKHYVEMNKNIQNYAIQQRKLKQQQIKQWPQKQFRNSKEVKKRQIHTRQQKVSPSKKATKTQPKISVNKYEDYLLNLEVDPWSVVEPDYS